MMEALAQWDGPATILLALFVAYELREMRKAMARLIELHARQDERQRMEAVRRGRRSVPPMYMTQTPAQGVPAYVDPEESYQHHKENPR